MQATLLSPLGRRLAIVCLAALCVSGCGSSVTKENYNKIKNGMTESEVTNILGSPTRSQDFLGSKKSFWEDDNKVIMITFQSRKVAGHAFIDAKDMANAMNNIKPGEQPKVIDPFGTGNNPKQDAAPWKVENKPNPIQQPNKPVGNNPGVTKANFDRIQNGMTLQEVTAILGQPSENTALGDVNFLKWNQAANVVPLVTIHMRQGKVVAKFSHNLN